MYTCDLCHKRNYASFDEAERAIRRLSAKLRLCVYPCGIDATTWHIGVADRHALDAEAQLQAVA